ncbi:hypothetical protein AKJ57_05250 [candidate division MSBL1 archaeon SCGC-AAA259A05]|uniref:Uncharacterized protein n=1 Tax=candidate division MSBL1 archaeon SCGC-AAA259A05 TaxID=1698259 RepID=A0A133U5K9_9EURY|nr:hypothetical protein AKJ57_05250 [candidate division MSBL1 archaeon SCGC-AAA259A05]
MQEIEPEKSRLTSLFNYVRKKVDDPRLKDSKLRVIGLSQKARVRSGDKLAGRVTMDYLEGTKIVVLNAAKTREMSDAGVVGLIAHELAHFLLKKSGDFPPKEARDPYYVLKKSEEGADKMATEWGFGIEVKVARAEIEGFENSELTLNKYLSLVKNWSLSKGFKGTHNTDESFKD